MHYVVHVKARLRDLALPSELFQGRHTAAKGREKQEVTHCVYRKGERERERRESAQQTSFDGANRSLAGFLWPRKSDINQLHDWDATKSLLLSVYDGSLFVIPFYPLLCRVRTLLVYSICKSRFSLSWRRFHRKRVSVRASHFCEERAHLSLVKLVQNCTLIAFTIRTKKEGWRNSWMENPDILLILFPRESFYRSRHSRSAL